jgi:hypothetical protein
MIYQPIITPSNCSTIKTIFKKESHSKTRSTTRTAFQPTKIIPNHPKTSKNKDSININNFSNGTVNHGEKNEKVNNVCRLRKNNSSFNLDYPQTVKNASSSKFNFKQNSKEKTTYLPSQKISNFRYEKNVEKNCLSTLNSNKSIYDVYKKKRQSSAKPKSSCLLIEGGQKRKIQIINTGLISSNSQPTELTNIILNNWANKENIDLNKIHSMDIESKKDKFNFEQNENEMLVEINPISETTTGTNSKESKFSQITYDNPVANTENICNTYKDFDIIPGVDYDSVPHNEELKENPKIYGQTIAMENFNELNELNETSNSELENKSNPSEDLTPLPQFLREGLKDIYLNLLDEERHLNSTFGYMHRQADINEQMRAILIDWLVEVHLKFSLRDETLFLTVSLIDRYLNIQNISRSNLQLLGVGALMIACKEEEILTPHVKDFVFITDKAYSKEQVLSMERDILEVLNYDILHPSSLRLFEIIGQFLHLNKKQFMLGRYFLEVCLIDYRMTKYSPSLIACTCAYITMKYFCLPDYHKVYSTFLLGNSHTAVLKECAKEICILVDNLNLTNLTALKRKFARQDYCGVSSISFA